MNESLYMTKLSAVCAALGLDLNEMLTATTPPNHEKTASADADIDTAYLRGILLKCAELGYPLEKAGQIFGGLGGMMPGVPGTPSMGRMMSGAGGALGGLWGGGLGQMGKGWQQGMQGYDQRVQRNNNRMMGMGKTLFGGVGTAMSFGKGLLQGGAGKGWQGVKDYWKGIGNNFRGQPTAGAPAPAAPAGPAQAAPAPAVAAPSATPMPPPAAAAPAAAPKPPVSAQENPWLYP